MTRIRRPQLLLACPGSEVADLEEEVSAECKRGRVFTVDGQDFRLSQLQCSKNPASVAQWTGAACGEDGRGGLAAIGHQTARGLVALIEVCFRTETLETLYAASVVRGSIGSAAHNVQRPVFVAGKSFYGAVNPDRHYRLDGQQNAFARLLGSQKVALRYIPQSSNYYLARGHLVPKADFMWGPQQRATFYYINVAPQWQTFNGGNWKSLEVSTRALAAARARDLLVVTGTWGRAVLPDALGRDTELYINADELIPVPALYWKVVVDEASGEGVAFVGVNNPYTSLADEPRLRLCPDVCDAVDWVSWAPGSVKAGEGYCCEVDALRKAVPDVPPLAVTRLLAKA